MRMKNVVCAGVVCEKMYGDGADGVKVSDDGFHEVKVKVDSIQDDGRKSDDDFY